MKSDKDFLLSVSRAAMRLSKVPVNVGWADDEPAGAPPEAGAQDEGDVRNCDESAGAQQFGTEQDLPPEVVGVPQGAFQCS